MKIIGSVVGVFLLVLAGFIGIGYFFYVSLSEPDNFIILLVLSHIGLILGIYFSRKMIPKKTLSHRATEKTLID